MRKRQRLVWLIFILLAVAATVLGQALIRSRAELAVIPPEQVGQEGPLVASGAIRADEVRIAAELGGRILEMPLAVGDSVQAGQLLVLLDDTQVHSMRLEEEAAVAVAEADLAAAEAGPTAEEIAAAQAAVEISRAQRGQARAAWLSAEAIVEDPQDLDAAIVDAQTQADLAEQAVELAEAQLAQQQLLRDQYQPGSLERQTSDLQVRAGEAALAAAQSDLEAAQAMVNGLWSIRNQPLALLAQANAAEGQYRLAQESISVARAQLDDLLAGPTPEEIAVAQASLSLAQAQARAVAVQEEKFRLSAPTGGVVLSQDARPGEVVAPAAPIMTIASLDQVTLVVYVPVNHIGRVRLGQQVQVSADSFPGRSFAGQVTGIGAEPEFTPRNVATAEERINTFYQVEISLPNPDLLLKPGMPADALFIGEE
ncbi:MAG: efflux RND transporter periplasmic adaptor subunit [Chloroflexota bacterium]|jgi:HlyD family secretion protein